MQRPDRLRLIGIEFHGFHGAFPQERELGHRFRVDITLELDLRPAASTDDLNRSVNYAAAAAAVVEIGTGPSVQLVETLAERIAERLLADSPEVDAVEVRVAKLHPPVPIQMEASVAEIRRER